MRLAPETANGDVLRGKLRLISYLQPYDPLYFAGAPPHEEFWERCTRTREPREPCAVRDAPVHTLGFARARAWRRITSVLDSKSPVASAGRKSVSISDYSLTLTRLPTA